MGMILLALFLVLAIGACTLFLLALLRWVVLVSFAILICIGLASAGIAGVTLLGLSVALGTEHAFVTIAISIATGVLAFPLLLRGIINELSHGTNTPSKGTHHAR